MPRLYWGETLVMQEGWRDVNQPDYRYAPPILYFVGEEVGQVDPDVLKGVKWRETYSQLGNQEHAIRVWNFATTKDFERAFPQFKGMTLDQIKSILGKR